MTARKEADRCRAAMAEPCTFCLFFGVGVLVGVSVGVSISLRIIPLTIQMTHEKAAFCGENTPLITIKRRGRKVAKSLYI